MVLVGLNMQVRVLAFGPLAESLGGRTHDVTIPPNSSIRFLVEELGIDEWLGQSISISVNDQIVNEDFPLSDGDEIALLPPVSGG